MCRSVRTKLCEEGNSWPDHTFSVFARIFFEEQGRRLVDR